MKIRCPVCRVEDNADPKCRRCKADLTLLSRVDQAQEACLREAQYHAGRGDAKSCETDALRARELAASREAEQWLAVSALLRRDFAGALQHYRAWAKQKRGE